jgi:hypothetical protein
MTETTSEQRLIPGAMARGVVIPQMLQVDVHCSQEVTGRVQIPGDPQDRWHAKVHKNLGHVAQQDCQSPDLSGAIRFDILKMPPKLDKLHQLIMVILGVEPPSLCLC